MSGSPRDLWMQAWDEYPVSVVGRICRYHELMEEAGYVIDHEQAVPGENTFGPRVAAPVAPKGDDA